jgi:hypothetical protein
LAGLEDPDSVVFLVLVRVLKIQTRRQRKRRRIAAKAPPAFATRKALRAGHTAGKELSIIAIGYSRSDELV